VLARHAGIAGDPASAAVLAAMWSEAEARLPNDAIEPYTQGMMDLGATICTASSPACLLCPVAEDCVARREDRVAELPGKKAKRIARTRQVGMLVVLSRGEVMLEKRPPRGIWGGLWSLPEIDVDADPQAVAAQRWSVKRAKVVALAPFSHAFTHYTLEVTPWRLDLGKPTASLEGAAWMPLDAIAGAALPSPIRALLTRVAAGAGSDAAPPSAGPRRSARASSA
jgi:A/G-specific adenine glycosylase